MTPREGNPGGPLGVMELSSDKQRGKKGGRILPGESAAASVSREDILDLDKRRVFSEICGAWDSSSRRR